VHKVGLGIPTDGSYEGHGISEVVNPEMPWFFDAFELAENGTFTPDEPAFSSDGAFLATASGDGTVRIWDVIPGALLATLVPLPDGGYFTQLPDGSYKLDGDPTDRVWWAIKLCRFEAGELDPYVPNIKRLPAEARILPDT
jgi:WD40 repeat protein